MTNIANNRSELIFILDRSGSMYQAASDVVGGFNGNLQANKLLPGDCTVTTVLFNDHVTLLHDRLPIQAVEPITAADYQPGGMTALLDAIGQAMTKVEKAHSAMSPAYRPGKVQFIIMTDGLENASREYTRSMIHNRITKAKAELGWDFLFLGANIDAITTAKEMGIDADSAVDALTDAGGMKAQFEAVSRANRALRVGNPTLRQTWSAPVEADRQNRGI